MYRDPQRSDPLRRICALLAWFALAGVTLPLDAQIVRVGTEENFRMEPNGGLLGTLEPGSELTFVEARETWVQAEIEGWVWARSLQVVDRDGYDLVVSADGGENLRTRPQGALVARLVEGALLEELERIPGWILVRRRGWVWRASVEVEEGAGSTPVPQQTAPAPRAAPESGGAATFRPESGTAVLREPGGDTLTVVRDPGSVAVVESRDGWARVLVEGWVRLPEGATVEPESTAGSRSGASGLDRGRTLADVAADPAGSVGAVVEWELQKISLERAEGLRVEFEVGEPYLLMRPAGEGTGRFVYVVIPESAVADAEDFAPLERFMVRGRVRSGASPMTGGPVLDLIEMTRRRAPR